MQSNKPTSVTPSRMLGKAHCVAAIHRISTLSNWCFLLGDYLCLELKPLKPFFPGVSLGGCRLTNRQKVVLRSPRGRNQHGMRGRNSCPTQHLSNGFCSTNTKTSVYMCFEDFHNFD